MTKIDDIKTAIAKLADNELASLRDWLIEMDEKRFDAKIEADAKAGKLDELFEKAKANHAAGHRSPL